MASIAKLISGLAMIIGLFCLLVLGLSVFYFAPSTIAKGSSMAIMIGLYWLYNQYVVVPAGSVALQLDSDMMPYCERNSGSAWLRPLHSLFEVDGKPAFFRKVFRVEVSIPSPDASYTATLEMKFTLADLVGLFRYRVQRVAQDWPRIRGFVNGNSLTEHHAKEAARQVLRQTMNLGRDNKPPVQCQLTLSLLTIMDKWRRDADRNVGVDGLHVDRTNIPYHLWFNCTESSVLVRQSSDSPSTSSSNGVHYSGTQRAGDRDYQTTWNHLKECYKILCSSEMINVTPLKADLLTRIQIAKMALELVKMHPPYSDISKLVNRLASESKLFS